MTPIYIGYSFKVAPLQPACDILVAELGALGFESFVETANGINAYIQKPDWYRSILDEVYVLNSNEFKIKFQFQEIEQVNWNTEWEKNFSPILVDEVCSVRAPFHEKPTGVAYDIIIEPKMSFGTGHHETTHMMIQYLLEVELDNLEVLDMGCGTGVLAILACMRGAKSAEAIDIDNWCYLNTLENAERNEIKNICVLEGNAQLVQNKNFDLVIANINRNILLKDMETYAQTLSKGGLLLVSGFYREDLALITEKCESLGLEFVSNKERNRWISAHFIKKALVKIPQQ